MNLLNCIFQSESSSSYLTIILTWFATFGLAIWNFIQLRKIESVKTDLQKRLNIHKLQFEKEFEIYKEVSLQLNTLREKISILRPEADHYDPKFTYEETIAQRVREAIIEGNKLIDITEANRPFYAEEIYQKLKIINGLVRKEVIEVSYSDKTEEKYWKEGKQTIDTYVKLIGEISDSIRKRIGNMNEI